MILAIMVTAFWIPYAGRMWMHYPLTFSDIIQGLIKELREAVERNNYGNHHM